MIMIRYIVRYQKYVHCTTSWQGTVVGEVSASAERTGQDIESEQPVSAQDSRAFQEEEGS